MEFAFDIQIIASFLSLTALEIVLGIDNVVFIALIINHLPAAEQERARIVGLILALLLRIALLFGVVWLIGLKEPWLSFVGFTFSGKDVMMMGGGLFLLAKATSSIREEVTGVQKEAYEEFSGGFAITIAQIMLIDFIFSFDSVITAVGLTKHIGVIIAAMTIAMLVMLASSRFISDFITQRPTLKMLALAFILMIGVFLVAEGLGQHLPRGYIYFGMAFSLGVEILNMLAKRKKERRKND
ncbi:TerC family protein [Rickettsiales bacterium]|nr:TerC family protein [Rickettsiales bacterium]